MNENSHRPKWLNKEYSEQLYGPEQAHRSAYLSS
jgi:hypothetical protein